LISKTLPRVRIPLGSEHRDIDLQSAFTRTFEQGQFGIVIDYGQDPAVPLNDEQRTWLRDLLKRHKLRD